MPNPENLRPFNKGYDPRRGSKPKGSKHIATYIREFLEDEKFKYKLTNGRVVSGRPIEAILKAVIVKAIDGDLKALDLLAKYGYGNLLEVTVQDEPRRLELTVRQLEQLLELQRERELKEPNNY